MQFPELASENNKEERPSVVPIFTTIPSVAIPDMTVGITLAKKDVKVARIAERAFKGYAGILVLKPMEQQPPDFPKRQDFHDVGVLVQILRMELDSPTSAKILLKVHTRIHAKSITAKDGCYFADITYPEEIFPTEIHAR